MRAPSNSAARASSKVLQVARRGRDLNAHTKLANDGADSIGDLTISTRANEAPGEVPSDDIFKVSKRLKSVQPA